MFYLTVPVQSYFFHLFKWIQKKKATANSCSALESILMVLKVHILINVFIFI